MPLKDFSGNPLAGGRSVRRLRIRYDESSRAQKPTREIQGMQTTTAQYGQALSQAFVLADRWDPLFRFLAPIPDLALSGHWQLSSVRYYFIVRFLPEIRPLVRVLSVASCGKAKLTVMTRGARDLPRRVITSPRSEIVKAGLDGDGVVIEERVRCHPIRSFARKQSHYFSPCIKFGLTLGKNQLALM